MVEATELVACHVFSLAEGEGQRVSMDLVRTEGARTPSKAMGRTKSGETKSGDLDRALVFDRNRALTESAAKYRRKTWASAKASAPWETSNKGTSQLNV